jgi:hypothetical protein
MGHVGQGIVRLKDFNRLPARGSLVNTNTRGVLMFRESIPLREPQLYLISYLVSRLRFPRTRFL